MDLDLLKTFLEVSRTRHFGQAAENLFLTQSAVSSRMRLLEQIVGTPLLSRVRGNIHPTPAGERLLDHADHIIDAWNRAQMDNSLAEELTIPLTIGVAPNLWDAALQRWLETVRQELPNVALSVEQHAMPTLAQRLQQGHIDVALSFEKPAIAGLEFVKLGAESLILVSTRTDLTVHEALQQSYVMVDWGAEVAAAHAELYTATPTVNARFSIEQQAREFLLSCGGSAYLSQTLIEADLVAARLHRLDGARTLNRVTYAAFHSSAAQSGILKRALQCLPALAAAWQAQ